MFVLVFWEDVKNSILLGESLCRENCWGVRKFWRVFRFDVSLSGGEWDRSLGRMIIDCYVVRWKFGKVMLGFFSYCCLWDEFFVF